MIRKLEKYKFFSLIVALTLLVGCREEFNPNIAPTDTNLLVVEGYISTNSQKSTINLSRTSSLVESFLPVETGAIVILNGENSGTWNFIEEIPGQYTLTADLPINQAYRLSIQLRNNEGYISDLMQPIVSPEIGKLKYVKNDSGVSVQVDLQGNEEATFFLWQYEEDWIFRSAIGTNYIYNRATGEIEETTPETTISRCFANNKVQRISIENSGRFNNFNISDKEITLIPNLSEKLAVRYSILVKQVAIGREAFDFWEIMRKNSEDIGGIFSPLPSLIGGNISKVGSENEKAIGYVSMGVISESRMYINNQDVSPWQVFIPEYEGCTARLDTIRPNRYAEVFGQGNLMPVNPIFNDVNILPVAFRSAPAFCVDCTLRGTKAEPSFWEN